MQEFALAAFAGLLCLGTIVWIVAERTRINRLRRSVREHETRAHAGVSLRDALIARGKESVAVWDGDSTAPLSFGGATALIDKCLAGPDASLLSPAIAELLESGARFNLFARGDDGRVFALRGVPIGRYAAVFLGPGQERRWARRDSAHPDAPNGPQHESPGFDSHSGVPAAADNAVFNALETDAVNDPRALDAPARTNFRRADDCAKDCADALDINGTAIAVFGPDRRLVFYNCSYPRRWGLPESWLETHPYEDDILDRLRDMRLLPEHSDFTAWKRNRRIASEQSDYRSTELWHLPEGKTVRVTSLRRLRGGTVSIYDDMTEALRLETAQNAMAKVHKATLDALDEAIAIFGPDGRLKDFNVAFVRQWKLDEAELRGEPLLNRIATACAARFGLSPLWEHIASTVTSSLSEPQMEGERFQRSDGAIISLSLTRLPDAAILARFAEVTPARRRASEKPAEKDETRIVAQLVRQGARPRLERL